MKQVLYAFLALAAPVLAQVTINPVPSREFGQPYLVVPTPVSSAPNLVEGRELYLPSAIAFDGSVSPPRVYVVDTGNNRVLGWSNANNLSQGNFADLVIGQSDLYSTLPLGPGTALSTGLNTPTGIAVDAKGNVYVGDSGNNRILRFKTPFSQQAGNLPVDLVIGQKSSTSNQANQGLQSPTASTIYFASSGRAFVAGLAIDGAGNLWVADSGNNRVLRFPVPTILPNTSAPAADLVLGQTSFTSGQLPQSGQTQSNLGFLGNPVSVAFDAAGNLYVADAAARVIQYVAPLSIGQPGSKVLGLPPTSSQATTYPTSSTLGAINSGGGIIGNPQGVFVLNGAQGTSVFVCDTPQSRVVRYDTFAGTWQVSAPANSPSQNGVIGQTGFVAGQANQGLTAPTNSTLSSPVAGAINPSNGEMWIVDQGNSRVVALPNQGGAVYSIATRVIGQTDFIFNGPNLLEGREIWVGGAGSGIAVDNSSNPPHLYIADSQNNRVLGFKDARSVGTDTRKLLTQKADLVIGQADLLHNMINYPTNSPQQRTATGLALPFGLAVDANGNLWVADSGNGRVLRFPAPFAQPQGTVQTANVVLGQPDFSTYNPNVNSFNMVEPFGVALFANGGLAVSDALANRVLVFNRPAGADFTSGHAADLVVGQPSFTVASPGNCSGSPVPPQCNSELNSPRHIAVDTSDRLYVCDSQNSRLMVFSKPINNNPVAAVQVPNLSQPQGVVVSLITGQSWVTSTNSSVLYQLPEFQTLQLKPQPTQTLGAYGPLAITLDAFDNLIVADSANRITFYFAQLYYRNTANFSAGVGQSSNGLTAGPTPTMLAAIARMGIGFSFTTSYTGSAVNMNPPWSTNVNNVQVAVNGIPAPIFRMDPSAVYIEIPNNAPSSGATDFVVSNPVTGQILAVATYNMQPASPGLYTTNSAGFGAVAANNYDGKTGGYLGVNSPTLPIATGNVIGLWLTGAGNVPGLPADGTAPGQGVATPITPLVFINGVSAQVVGSAMSPDFPGVWQVNAIVPASTPPSSSQPISVVVKMGDYASNIGGTNNPDGSLGADRPLQGAGLITTIYVK